MKTLAVTDAARVAALTLITLFVSAAAGCASAPSGKGDGNAAALSDAGGGADNSLGGGDTPQQGEVGGEVGTSSADSLAAGADGAPAETSVGDGGEEVKQPMCPPADRPEATLEVVLATTHLCMVPGECAIQWAKDIDGRTWHYYGKLNVANGKWSSDSDCQKAPGACKETTKFMDPSYAPIGLGWPEDGTKPKEFTGKYMVSGAELVDGKKPNYGYAAVMSCDDKKIFIDAPAYNGFHGTGEFERNGGDIYWTSTGTDLESGDKSSFKYKSL